MDKTKMSNVVFINEDGVLTRILSKLPLDDAVKTSVLSRRWRYIWTYLPNIYVSCPDHHNLNRCGFYDLYEETDRIVQIMDSVLKQHCGSGVETFSVDMPFYEKHAGSLDQWVAFAASANSKEFFMEFESMGNKCYDFPFHLLFQQNRQSSIKRLGLRSCSLQVPDGIIGCLRSLQTLEIQYVSICDADFQNLVSTCVVMEKLVVSSCTELMNMSIHQQSGRLKHLTVDHCPLLMNIDVQAKKLVSFVYRGNIINFSFQDVSLIIEGELGLISFDACALDFALMKLPNLLPQFQKLKLKFYCALKLTRVPEMSCHRFEHLKHLTVMAHYFVYGDSILFFIALLTLAPHLEKLTLELQMESPQMRMEVPIHNIPLAHLKEVEITEFTASEGQLLFLRYLCHNASSLRSMRICWSDFEEIWPSDHEEALGHLKRIVPPGLDVIISVQD